MQLLLYYASLALVDIPSSNFSAYNVALAKVSH